MKKFLPHLILPLLFIVLSLNVKSQLLYKTTLGNRLYNPGLGTNNIPAIIFDDVNIPNSVVGNSDSVVINQIKVAIGRAPGAPAVTVKIYAASVDPAYTLLNSLPAVPPKFLDSIDLPAGGFSNLFTFGDGITPRFTFPVDTSHAFAGFQTFYVGLSFSDSSNFSGTQKNTGWYFSNSPDFNYDLVYKYDKTNTTTPRTKYNFSGSFNLPATFYSEVYGTFKMAAPTPVTLKDFSVAKKDGQNILTWKTETENNSKEFTVEHSADGLNFKSIGTVKAAGTSTSVLIYHFIDNNPAAGTNYYRLYQVDKDNTGVYSSIKSVRNSAGTLFSIYPNPVENTMNVMIDAYKAGKAFLSVTDLDGKKVYSQYAEVLTGKNNLNFNMSSLAKGAYIARIQFNDEFFVTKFTKK